MIDFASQEDLTRALAAVERYTEPFHGAMKDGLAGLGLEVIDGSLTFDGRGTAEMILVARGRGLTFHVSFSHAMDAFLAADREAESFRVDESLADDAYARAKIEAVVSGRIAILEALQILLECGDVPEAKRRIDEHPRQLEWIRALFIEERRPRP